MIKKGKKFNIDSHKQFTASYGTVNSTQIKSIYIDISSWLEPIYDIDVDKSIKSLNKLIKKTIYENSGIYSNAYIVDLNLRGSGVRLNKKSFMNINITLFSTNKSSVDAANVESMVDVIINSITNNYSGTFIFNKKKNK